MPVKKGFAGERGERFFSDEDDYYDDPSIHRRKAVLQRHRKQQEKKYFSSDSEEEEDEDEFKGWSRATNTNNNSKNEKKEREDFVEAEKPGGGETRSVVDEPELQGLTITKDNVGVGISRVFKNSLLDGKNLKASDLRKVASLHLQRKEIVYITKDAFSQFGTLAHLYLYENNITRMSGLQDLQQLETLHLSGNRIRRIENLENAVNLRQLYLGNNELVMVQGLENNLMLTELHVENQKLPPGTSLIFDAQTSQALADTLRVLNISGNQLQDVNDFVGMNGLDTLDLSNNNLKDLDLVVVVLKDLMQLRNLNLSDNAVKKNPQYKEKIVGQCSNLELLDGRGVDYMQKRALQKMISVKEKRVQQKLQVQKMARSMQELWAKHQQGSLLPSSSAFASQSFGTQGFGIRTQQHSNSMSMAQRAPPKSFIPPGFLPQRAVGSRAVPTPVTAFNGLGFHESPERPQDQFVYSTPVRSSPVHLEYGDTYNVPAQESASRETTVGSDVFDTSQAHSRHETYEARTGMSGPGPIPAQDKTSRMSEMAKIIFRLSNLSPSSSFEGLRESTGKDAGGGYWGQGQGHSSRWNRPPAFKEARPLSPLEIDVGQPPRNVPSLGGARKAVPLRRPMAKKLPSRGVAGARMLSPLEELPTPDSIMGLEGGDWSSDIFQNVK